jgi:large subunit ribosomal protein L18e
MFAETVIDNTIWSLRNAFKRNKAPIWRALQEELAGPRANRREINVRRLAEITKADELVVVPGKVLGTGSLGHRVWRQGGEL